MIEMSSEDEREGASAKEPNVRIKYQVESVVPLRNVIGDFNLKEWESLSPADRFDWFLEKFYDEVDPVGNDVGAKQVLSFLYFCGYIQPSLPNEYKLTVDVED